MRTFIIMYYRKNREYKEHTAQACINMCIVPSFCPVVVKPVVYCASLQSKREIVHVHYINFIP